MTIAPDQTFPFQARRIEVSSADGGPTPANALLHIVGTRSEAVRIAPLVSALRTQSLPQAIARVLGQDALEGETLGSGDIPRTELFIDAPRDTDVQRTAGILAAAEQTLVEHRPAMVVLGGEGDGALAFALAASKLGVPIARLGAGLRCGDFSLSDEINRVLGDRLADVLFTDSDHVRDTLEVEGIPADRIVHAGNTTIDLLRRCELAAAQRATWKRFGLPAGGYVLATLHRAENVRDDLRLAQIVAELERLARRLPVVLPLHPVTDALLSETGEIARLRTAGVHVTTPLGYIDFLSLEQRAGAILTDSGGVQDEASALGVRCYTLRRATERVATLTHGTNVLLGDDPAEMAAIRLDDVPPGPAAIPLWDGQASHRIAAELSRRASLELASTR